MGNTGTKTSNSIHVIQGDYAVSSCDTDKITTILGSCVATCIYDPLARVGGMNHFLLPGDQFSNGGSASSYGLNAMELLINTLLKKGAKRDRFQAKLFGGARMIEGLSDIGEKNAKFATEFLAFEGIPCVSESLGGSNARRVRFWPTTGRAQLKLLGDASSVVSSEKPAIAPVPQASDVELF